MFPVRIHIYLHILFIPFYLTLFKVYGQCQIKQQSILIQFKNNVTFNSSLSTKLVSWDPNVTTDCCNWRGVNCSIQGEVIGLDLSNEMITSRIDDSSALFDLNNLERLNLAGNNFNFTHIPSAFGSLSSLSYLNLSNSRFTGQIPGELSLLTRLEVLDLSLNRNLYGSLPDAIGSLKNLSRLELQKNNFSGQIPKSMEKLTQLVHLDLSANSFSGLIPSFQMSKNLTHIDLSRNSLSGMIPSSYFQDLQSLVYVDLRYNGFFGSIPPSLFSLKLVQKIRLSNNNFNGLLPDFSDPSTSLLDTLDLSSNKLEGEIPKSLFELGKLSILLLSSNDLNGSIDFQGGLTNLMTLDLSFNNLSIISTTNLTLVNRLPKFTSLYLASCNLVKFPNLRNQTRLKNLDLSDNIIEGEIPSWIWRVGNEGLSYLNLSNNRLTSLQEPYHFLDLSVLDLHSNLLSGIIPVPPQKATFIDYSKNHFNSIFPEATGTNLSVAYISASDNLLTGAIPDTICNAPYLKVLDLSNNNLSGRIPNCLIEFGGSLGVLNLGNNSLSGQIEGTFPSTCGLKTLDLHGNSLEGKIPKSLVNCTMLEVLNLGSNRIYDKYPCFLGNNANLRVLVLRSNRLHGNVSCGENQYNNWSKLQILDLAFNDLSGKVPFWQWAAMMTDDPSRKKHLSFRVLQLTEFIYYQDAVTVTVTGKGPELKLVKVLTLFTSIDISSNHFSGEIPTTIGKLGALYLLNISNNGFTGPIPSSMGNLSQLEALDMSRNRLTGEIPETLTSLAFLSYLNLSYNQLNGKIPTGSQFQTFENHSYSGNKNLCGFPLDITCASTDLPAPKDPQSSEKSESGSDWLSFLHAMGAGAGTSVVITVLYSVYKRNTSGLSRQTSLSR